MNTDCDSTKIAKRFSNILAQWLGDKLHVVIALNKREEHQYSCASRDFCDSITAMTMAFNDECKQSLTPSIGYEEACSIQDKAWKIARENDFFRDAGSLNIQKGFYDIADELVDFVNTYANTLIVMNKCNGRDFLVREYGNGMMAVIFCINKCCCPKSLNDKAMVSVFKDRKFSTSVDIPYPTTKEALMIIHNSIFLI